MAGHEWQVIVALAVVISTLGGGIIKYLIKDNERLQGIIETSNKAVADANKVNVEMAALVPGLLQEAKEWRRKAENLQE